MALINYEQQKANVKTLVSKLQAKGLNKNVIIALVVNSLHESYANPNTLEGAVNPGPPLGAQGTGPGGGLWQWTPYQGKITLGDWDGQINFMLSNSSQYIAHGSWWNAAGVTEPVPSIDSWDDFLHSSAGAVALTQQFIGAWERPGYSYGVQRYNQAEADVSEVSAYVTGDIPNPKPDPDPKPEQPDVDEKDKGHLTLQVLMLGGILFKIAGERQAVEKTRKAKSKFIDEKYDKIAKVATSKAVNGLSKVGNSLNKLNSTPEGYVRTGTVNNNYMKKEMDAFRHSLFKR